MDYFTEIQKYINWQYLLVFMLFSYAFKGLLAKALKINKTVIVFTIGTVIAIPWLIYFKGDPMQLLISYAAGTSLHELILGFFIRKIKAFLPKEPEPLNPDK